MNLQGITKFAKDNKVALIVTGSIVAIIVGYKMYEKKQNNQAAVAQALSVATVKVPTPPITCTTCVPTTCGGGVWATIKKDINPFNW